LWTFGQQFYVIKRNPTPGSPAYEELMKKRATKNIENGGLPEQADESGTTQIDPNIGQRQQPSKKKKKKK
jgi:YidC/Oxa1 family membrane protein insertase